jgi:predicted MFS family arabinose efflux permease
MDRPPEPDEEQNFERPSDPIVEDQQDPEPPRSLLTKPVVLTISVYAAHAYLEISDYALVPVVYTTPIRLGGLGLDPIGMGTCLTAFGIITGIVPFFFFDRIVKFLGRRRALVTFMSGLVLAFLLFPINGTRARHVGMDVVTWTLVLLQLGNSYGVRCVLSFARGSHAP